MRISNITFLEEKNNDYVVLNSISGLEEIKKILITSGSIENDKIINFLNFSYNIDEFRLEMVDEKFLNLDLYLKKL
ncbi:hypothetical protein SAMN04488062_10420 [Flavobacterium omnivorum]|uniref:Uncharacterized protein n=1 Tax=Flavobacterium omnivorum TaxID=178355 RepID=A0A1G7ZD36_9FLAO|nr:hypothetical protein [Flavobacterium omnivorum]SDH06559.1 hypothetical protein SAMN04488062_10420 [Flavobacterium omnivorum]